MQLFSFTKYKKICNKRSILFLSTCRVIYGWFCDWGSRLFCKMPTNRFQFFVQHFEKGQAIYFWPVVKQRLIGREEREKSLGKKKFVRLDNMLPFGAFQTNSNLLNTFWYIGNILGFHMKALFLTSSRTLIAWQCPYSAKYNLIKSWYKMSKSIIRSQNHKKQKN